MSADTERVVTLFGLEVTDDAGYARYREAMTPILTRYGGAFGCDFVVARVLRGPNDRINRVFTITFPDAVTRERFFADEDYRKVRAQWFTPSVASAAVLEEATTRQQTP
jgi:uncharacterized protein (DUF1330 family)